MSILRKSDPCVRHIDAKHPGLVFASYAEQDVLPRSDPDRHMVWGGKRRVILRWDHRVVYVVAGSGTRDMMGYTGYQRTHLAFTTAVPCFDELRAKVGDAWCNRYSTIVSRECGLLTNRDLIWVHGPEFIPFMGFVPPLLDARRTLVITGEV